jgi:broad specificity phosphatase PhoE
VDYAPGGGESLRDMGERVRSWAYEAAAEQADVLAITHGGVMRLLTAWSRGEPLASVMDIPALGFGQMLRLPLERFATP